MYLRKVLIVTLLVTSLLSLLAGIFLRQPSATAQAARQMVAPSGQDSLPQIDNFEGGLPATWFQYGDYGSGTAITPTVVSTDSVPGLLTGNHAVEITYVSAGWGAGTGHDVGGQDWSQYSGLAFWLRGFNSGATLRLILSDNPNPNQAGDTAERFAYEWVDSSAGWRHIVIPWGAFFRDPGFQPAGALNDGLTLTNVQAYAIALPVGTAGTLYLDDVRLVHFSTIDTFDNDLPATWFQYGDYGSGTTISTTAVITTSIPGLANGNKALEIVYTSAGWGAGTGNNLSGQDWSQDAGVGFWFFGSNSSGTYRIILSDNLNPNQAGDTAERFAYEFPDNFSGWRFVSIPWALFFRDPGFQPGGAPNDGLTLTSLQAYAIALPAGTRTAVLDHVVRFGDGIQTRQVGFSEAAYTVVEGENALITVTLNLTSTAPITLHVATSDGTATQPADYTSVSTTLIIAPGAFSNSFQVATANNNVDAANKSLNLSVSNPQGANLARSTATLTIVDNDETQVPPTPAPAPGHGVIVDSYEISGTVIPHGVDANNVEVGFATWNASGASAAITLTIPPTQPAGKPNDNHAMRLDLNLSNGQWGGFTHNFENEAKNQWLSQDWSRYVGVSFWLYGNNTGATLFVDILDNRTAGSIKDDAERWSLEIADNFSGWKFFQIPFSQFQRKDIGNGAPFDGFGKTEIWGYALGGFGSAPIANKSYYIDDFALLQRTQAIDDFQAAALPHGMDANNVEVGFVTWNHPAASSVITLTTPITQPAGKDNSNQVLQMKLNIGTSQWAGFTHNFENASQNQWVSQDWSSYEGLCFWLYGNNTGSTLFVDLMDNRTAGSIKDDAERWSTEIPDNFSGWKFFQLPFTQFQRKDIGNGAPFDGFGKTEIWGYAFGGFGSTPINNQTYLVDDVTIYGNLGNTKVLQANFASAKSTVGEGQTATLTVTLNMTASATLTMTYASMESQATPAVDFTPVSGTLVFAPGVVAQAIQLPTLDDKKHEVTETVSVNLYSQQSIAGLPQRAILSIVDNDPVDTALVGDFVGYHNFALGAGITLTVSDLISGSANALPGQGAHEQVLVVQYAGSGPTSTLPVNSFEQTFLQAANWSNAQGISFWYFGNNSGKNVTVNLFNKGAAEQANAAQPTAWHLVWSDEFNEPAGTPPNPSKWLHELGDGALNGNPGWGNSELQYYTNDPANASTNGNGSLVIRSNAVNTTTTNLLCWYGPCAYTSARLISANRAEFEYGRIEARLKLPAGKAGLWPAFWMLGSNIEQVPWPQSGEIDIMEYVSRIPDKIFGTIHGPGYSGGASFGNTVTVTDVVAGYHTYAVEWSKDRVVWDVDGIQYHQAIPANVAPKEWVYNHPFFLILNMAIGGNFGGTVSPELTMPQEFLVDYVRVYQTAPLTYTRYAASFVDNFTGWKRIVLPFSSFTKSGVNQATGATVDLPQSQDAGVDLSAIWGYGFQMPSTLVAEVAASKVTYIDQVRLEANVPNRLLYFPIINR